MNTYTTKELTVRTWPDFERLFSQGNGWDFCWCMHFQRPRTLPENKRRRTRTERGVRNRREKKELVERGRGHGILVYANGEPVGWCRRRGGGVVEAYPIIPWEELCRARVRRCGHAPAFGNSSTQGTLSMFEKQGFKVVGPSGLNNLVVRKTVAVARDEEETAGGTRTIMGL